MFQLIAGEREMKRQKRTSESSPSDCKECEEPSLIATEGENTDSGAECLHCSGSILETDAARKMLQVVP
jgi:hypothetical protein